MSDEINDENTTDQPSDESQPVGSPLVDRRGEIEGKKLSPLKIAVMCAGALGLAGLVWLMLDADWAPKNDKEPSMAGDGSAPPVPQSEIDAEGKVDPPPQDEPPPGIDWERLGAETSIFRASNTLTDNTLDPNARPRAMTHNERFFADRATIQSVRPLTTSRLQNPDCLLLEGETIEATLETAIESGFNGQLRAITARPVRSFEGFNVLVPPGTRLLGESNGRTEFGQHRVYVMWHRAILPDGTDVPLMSLGTGPLGRTGVGAQADYHFWERFGYSALTALLDVGASNVDQDPAATAVAGAGADQATSISGNWINRPPTLYVDQGAPISIYVNRDIDFCAGESGAPPARNLGAQR